MIARHQLLLVGEQALEVVGELPELLVLGFELLALEAGEAAEAHVEDRLRLARGQVDELLRARRPRPPPAGRPARSRKPPSPPSFSAIRRSLALSVSFDRRG